MFLGSAVWLVGYYSMMSYLDRTTLAGTPLGSVVPPLPASSNTRVDSQDTPPPRISVDTICFVLSVGHDVARLRRCLECVGLGDCLESWETSRFQSTVRVETYRYGARVEISVDAAGCSRLSVYLGGTYISAIGGIELHRIASLLHREYGCTASRIDVAFDVYGEDVILPAEMREWIRNGSVTHYKTVREYTTLQGKSQGTTFYFGSPNSDKMLRYYDKGGQLNETIPHHRLELQARRKVAESVFSDWISGSDGGELILRSALAGSLNFVERVDKNLDRCSVLPRWAEFIRLLSDTPIRYSAPQRPPCSIAESIAWMRRSVARVMARVSVAARMRWIEILHDMLTLGRSKFDDHDRFAIDQYRMYDEIGT